jgi:hypothetical protein
MLLESVVYKSAQVFMRFLGETSIDNPYSLSPDMFNPPWTVYRQTLMHDDLERRMSSIDDQIRTRRKTPSLAQQENDGSSELVRRRETIEHGTAEPFFFEMRSGRE